MSQTVEIDSQHPSFHEDEEDEEEALSLCDLPVTSSSENKQHAQNEVDSPTVNDSDFDFDFGSLTGSVTAADELFSDGQLLPFRHSVSSEGGFPGSRVGNSRSDSVDRVTGLGLGPSRSSSSRSSSTRSQQSATSSISMSSSSSMGLPKPKPKPKPKNHFHSHPSPNPQIRAPGSRSVNPKSTMWQVLRLGLVRTPEIELLQDRRGSSSKNITKNNSISSSSSSVDECNKIGDLLREIPKTKSHKNSKINGGGIFGSCKCSIGAIEPILIMNEDKVLAQKKTRQQQQQQQQQPKRVASHHRTFEWLIRDLSQTSLQNS